MPEPTNEPIEEPITVRSPKPDYGEWLKSLKSQAEAARKEEEEEQRWRQRYGKA